MTLALLSVTDNEPRWEAGPNRPGVWYVPVEGSDPRVAALRVAVTETRNRAGIDLVIVAAHWGTNWGYRPEPGHREVAHALLDAGAGIVYGHSSHVARGIETRRGGAILYGAGDFIDDYVVDEVEPNDEAFLFMAEWSGARLEGLRAYPFLIRAFRPTRAEGPRRDAMTRRMVSLCGELATAAVWDESEGALRVAAANDVRDPLPRGVHVDHPLRERDLDPLVREPPV
jgi:poly-gamma-glutamate synthesis protein (capsule biosynthesis protein)